MPPTSTRIARALGVGLAAGLILGAGGRASAHLHGLLGVAGALGGPWMLGAFLAGTLTHSRIGGALAGSVAIVSGTFIYYVLSHWVEHRNGLHYAFAAGVGWALVGVVVGAVFGAAGGAWREGGGMRAAAAGLLVGGLVAESVLLAHVWHGDTQQRAVVVQLVVAAVLAVILVGRARLLPLAVAVASVSAGALVVGEFVVRDLLRTSGWAGA